MSSNIIPSLLPLRNLYGHPIIIMHSKTQVHIGDLKCWKMASLMITIETMYSCLTSNTFVFDRGKVAAIVSYTTSTVTGNLIWNNLQNYVTRLEINIGQYDDLEILVLLSSARLLTSSCNITGNERNSDSRTKNSCSTTIVIRNKCNRQISKILFQAQMFLTLYETAIVKLLYKKVTVTVVNPISRAERTINSNRPLITGQPVFHQDFTQQSMNIWIFPSISQLSEREHLKSQVVADDANQYMNLYANIYEQLSVTDEGGSQSGGFTRNTILTNEPE
jgi:hypothetical protein